jgi:hypothetical protein
LRENIPAILLRRREELVLSEVENGRSKNERIEKDY